MLQATLVNTYQLVCVTQDKWYFQGNYNNYSEAAQQAMSFTKARPGKTYYVSTCDPLKAVFQTEPPEEYSE